MNMSLSTVIFSEFFTKFREGIDYEPELKISVGSRLVPKVFLKDSPFLHVSLCLSILSTEPEL